jgi:signal transduction histidine kinase
MRRFNPPILAGIVGLVAVSLLMALGAMLLVTFRGPPPHARPLSIDDVAIAIRATQPEINDWRLETGHLAGVPAVPQDMRARRSLALALARRLGTDPANIRLYASTRRPGRPGPQPGGYGPPMLRFGEADDHMPILHEAFLAAWRGRNGGWSYLEGERHGSLRWYAVTLSLMLLIFALLLIPAYIIARRITRPIRLLAEGVAAGRVEHADPLPVGGPPEVRRLGDAFNRMRSLLIDHVAARTAMLGAIAHDLRTPMTRLSFRLEHLPEADRAKAQADVDEMHGMVTALLDFVRGGSDPLVPIRMDLSALVETLVDDMTDMHRDVVVGDSVRAVIGGDAAALRRCIANIVENAVRYGARARLSLRVERDWALLTVDDDGPGITSAQMARMCEPFYRGEQSRNRATGGVGLGLSIARAILEKHGGQLSFANREEGGLRVTAALPLVA